MADRLKQINRGEHPCPKIDLDRAIDWVGERSGFELAASQQKALRQSICSKVAVITGGGSWKNNSGSIHINGSARKKK